MSGDAVIWHDLECGEYGADLPTWLELAASAGGPILDIGAGTGRVAMALAGAGHSVTALERDEDLAQELRRRAAGLAVAVICADACSFSLEESFALCLVAMLTVHLFEDRDGFLRSARACMAPGGQLAVSVLGGGVDAFEVELAPDEARHDGVWYRSYPTALRQDAAGIELERRREVSDDGVVRSQEIERLRLQPLDAARLRNEAAVHGLEAAGSRRVAATVEHAANNIVLLRRPA